MSSITWLGCIEEPGTLGETFDIGQPDVTNYRELMEIYAQEAGLRRRLVIPVPVLTPRLSSYWIHLVTPVPASIATALGRRLESPGGLSRRTGLPGSCPRTFSVPVKRFGWPLIAFDNTRWKPPGPTLEKSALQNGASLVILAGPEAVFTMTREKSF